MPITVDLAAPMESGGVAREGGLRRILMASDLTAYADRAFDRAVLLARAHGAALSFLHVVDASLLPASYVRRGLRKAQAALEHEVKDSGADQDLTVSVKAASGDADRVVIDEARAMRADLIVIGLSQDSTLTSIVRGTTVDKVVRGAPCPVLVAKTRARRAYANVAVAFDPAEGSRRALDLALRLFPSTRLTVIHVDESAPAERTTDVALDAAGLESRRQITDLVAAACTAAGRGGPGAPDGPALTFAGGKAALAVHEQVVRLNPDLVVLGTHGRTGVSGLLLGSVAESLLEALPQDVLVTRG